MNDVYPGLHNSRAIIFVHQGLQQLGEQQVKVLLKQRPIILRQSTLSNSLQNRAARQTSEVTRKPVGGCQCREVRSSLLRENLAGFLTVFDTTNASNLFAT